MRPKRWIIHFLEFTHSFRESKFLCFGDFILLNSGIGNQNSENTIFRIFRFPAPFADKRLRAGFCAILSASGMGLTPLFIGE